MAVDELLLGYFPDELPQLRWLAGLVITVLGLAEFFSLFGVKVTAALDRVHDWLP